MLLEMKFMVIEFLVVRKRLDLFRNADKDLQVPEGKPPDRGFVPPGSQGKVNQEGELVVIQPLKGLFIIHYGHVERSVLGIPVFHQPVESLLAAPDGFRQGSQLRIAVFEQPHEYFVISIDRLSESNENFGRILG